MLPPKQILYPNRLVDESQFINKISTEIVLIIDIKIKTNRLIKKELNFRSIKKLVKFFQKTNIRVIYYKYYNIRHDKLGICGNRLSIYKIYKKGLQH